MTERIEPNEAATPGRVAGSGGPVPAEHAGACGAEAFDVDCDRALRDLYTYLDGEMTEERRAHIRRHIEACAPCLDAFDFEVELRRLVARTCRCDAPDDLRDRVAQAIHDCDGRVEDDPIR